MKEAVTKVIDTRTQEDFRRAFQKLLERYNKRIATGGAYFEGDKGLMCGLSIKVPIRKRSENLFNDPRMIFSKKVSLLFIRCEFFTQVLLGVFTLLLILSLSDTQIL